MSEADAVNRELLAAIDDKRMLVLATGVRAPSGDTERVGAKLLIDEDEKVTGSLGRAELDRQVATDALAAMQERKSRVADYPASNGAHTDAAAVGVFLEVVEPQPSLIVVGAGHIAVPLAQMGK